MTDVVEVPSGPPLPPSSAYLAVIGLPTCTVAAPAVVLCTVTVKEPPPSVSGFPIVRACAESSLPRRRRGRRRVEQQRGVAAVPGAPQQHARLQPQPVLLVGAEPGVLAAGRRLLQPVDRAVGRGQRQRADAAAAGHR